MNNAPRVAEPNDNRIGSFVDGANGSQRVLANRLTLALPFSALILYAVFSYPMMYPGFDIWLHMASIDDGTRVVWHNYWTSFFGVVDVGGVFARAKFIHGVQVLAIGGLVFVAARLLLDVLFAGAGVQPYRLNLAAWLALVIWLAMHGTVSTAINGSEPKWFAWLQWYSVNYQITLPMYVFAAAALLRSIPGVEPRLSWGMRLLLVAAALLAAWGIAVLHAGEMPYLLMAVVLMTVLFTSRRYLWVVALLALIGYGLFEVGLHYSWRLPPGLRAYQQGGWVGLNTWIQAAGETLVVGGLNRGDATWHAWYSLAFALGVGVIALYLRERVGGSRLRAAIFLLLTATPSVMIHIPYAAGILGAVTGPGIVSRFSFSSFLFLIPSVAILSLPMVAPRFGRLRFQVVVAVGLLLLVPLYSRFFEPNAVAYRYSTSLVKAVVPAKMHYGLTGSEELWLTRVRDSLVDDPPERAICTDTFTAYYLAFVAESPLAMLPSRVRNFGSGVRPIDCSFPRDGGEILLERGFAPPPWSF